MKVRFLHLIVLCFTLFSQVNVRADDRTVMSIDGRDVKVDEFLYLYNKNRYNGDLSSSPRDYARMFAVFKMKVLEAEKAGIDTTAQFRNELAGYLAGMDNVNPLLEKEYREGIMLFEISNLMVWQKAANDSEALNNHFLANRDGYRWDSPRAKGWIISAADSVTASDVKRFLADNDDIDDLRPALRLRYGMKVKAEKYLVKEGVNPMVDELVFHQSAGFVTGKDWAISWAHNCRVISSPEEWTDVRGSVTSDYQDLLARQWEESLWNNHDVVFNYDVIDEITSA